MSKTVRQLENLESVQLVQNKEKFYVAYKNNQVDSIEIERKMKEQRDSEPEIKIQNRFPAKKREELQLAQIKIQNNETCSFPAIMISEKGLAYVSDKNMEQFCLRMMKVKKVLLPESDWVAFLGYHRYDSGDSEDEECYENKTQYCHLFSQSDLSQCLHTFKAEKGCKITEIAELGLDTFAVARDDGSVTVKVLRKHSPTSHTFSEIHDE